MYEILASIYIHMCTYFHFNFHLMYNLDMIKKIEIYFIINFLFIIIILLFYIIVLYFVFFFILHIIYNNSVYNKWKIFLFFLYFIGMYTFNLTLYIYLCSKKKKKPIAGKYNNFFTYTNTKIYTWKCTKIIIIAKAKQNRTNKK